MVDVVSIPHGASGSMGSAWITPVTSVGRGTQSVDRLIGSLRRPWSGMDYPGTHIKALGCVSAALAPRLWQRPAGASCRRSPRRWQLTSHRTFRSDSIQRCFLALRQIYRLSRSASFPDNLKYISFPFPDRSGTVPNCPESTIRPGNQNRQASNTTLKSDDPNVSY